MTAAEKKACRHLLLENANTSNYSDKSDSSDSELESSGSSGNGSSSDSNSSDYSSGSSNNEGQQERALSLRSRVEQRKQRKAQESNSASKYINCDFIMGSAAVVESNWSGLDHFITKRRKGMSPLLTEMIMFLKRNKDLWSIKNVKVANDDRKSDKKSERVKKLLDAEKELATMLESLENDKAVGTAGDANDEVDKAGKKKRKSKSKKSKHKKKKSKRSND
jgi:prophage tail gpP-like protein